MSPSSLEALDVSQRLEAADSERRGSSIPCRKNGPQLHIVVFGATGYIGSAVVQELSARKHNVTAVMRASPGVQMPTGVTAALADVTDEASLERLSTSLIVARPDAVVCCLASRGGGKQDAWKIDFRATVNCIRWAQAAKVPHFLLLSALCVQRPRLALHAAKLAAEEALRAASEAGLSYTIVRPTAFIKSLVSQVTRVKDGNRFVIFGSGDTVRCAPISRQDLAAFMADCLCDVSKRNVTLPIGGPGPALSKREQGLLIFHLLQKDPKFLHVPLAVLDVVEAIANVFAWLLPKWCSDSPEYARIIRYYATESMLVFDPQTGSYSEDLTPCYGNVSFREFLIQALQPGSGLLREERMGEAGLWRE
eukprot:TRINITY_DN18560_c0_g1_i1.p1 TRINITY_DN18560_c0_g1~~TRINITY_DN18560_c0_g1_i1.p1  ORF type:complete len:365 (-),score=70.80 TRINITY_DN18560_c0_g1_i1:14-1108(-)